MVLGAIASFVAIVGGVLSLRQLYAKSRSEFDMIELEVEHTKTEDGSRWIAIRIENVSDRKILIKHCSLRAVVDNHEYLLTACVLEHVNRLGLPVGSDPAEDLQVDVGGFVECYVDEDFSSAELNWHKIKGSRSVPDALTKLSKMSVPQLREVVVETPLGSEADDFEIDDFPLATESSEHYLRQNWRALKSEK